MTLSLDKLSCVCVLVCTVRQVSVVDFYFSKLFYVFSINFCGLFCSLLNFLLALYHKCVLFVVGKAKMVFILK